MQGADVKSLKRKMAQQEREDKRAKYYEQQIASTSMARYSLVAYFFCILRRSCISKVSKVSMEVKFLLNVLV